VNVRLVVAACLASAAGIGTAVAVSACQSSQAKNDALAKQGATILKKEKGLQVTQTSSTVKVLNTAVLTDANGSAVVVTLKNNSAQALESVPIAINVKDAKGKSVFKNDDPGLEPALVSVPQMLPGQTVDWVDDQILASGTPKSVDVKVGVTQQTLPPNPPQVEATPPKLKVDPVSGVQAEGTVKNDSSIQQVNLTLFGVARKGNQVVAAGRGGIKTIAPNGGTRPYHIYFIGDPKGAQVTVTAPPSTFN
jgi:hypothetical protein